MSGAISFGTWWLHNAQFIYALLVLTAYGSVMFSIGWAAKCANIRGRLRHALGRYARREVTKLHTENTQLCDENCRLKTELENERARVRAMAQRSYEAIDIGHLKGAEAIEASNVRRIR